MDPEPRVALGHLTPGREVARRVLDGEVGVLVEEQAGELTFFDRSGEVEQWHRLVGQVGEHTDARHRDCAPVTSCPGRAPVSVSWSWVTSPPTMVER